MSRIILVGREDNGWWRQITDRSTSNLQDPSLKIQLSNNRRETFGPWILMLLWILDVAPRLQSLAPAAKAQRIANYYQIRQSHGCGAKDGAHQSHRRQRHSHGIVKKCPKEVLLDRSQGSTRQAKSLGDRLDFRVEQDYVRRFARNIARPADGDAKIRLLQRGCVINSVAHKCHPLSLNLQLPDHLSFLFRTDLRENIFGIDACLFGDNESGLRTVTGQQIDFESLPLKFRDHFS